MKYKLLLIAIFSIAFLTVNIQDTYSLNTYVGIKILNLTDDPSASCAGEAGYGSQGRIRAISSIVGAEYTNEFPIYFELRNASDNSLIWDGNSTEDTDYVIGETIYLPDLIQMYSGSNYNLFFDVDAIRINLPAESHEQTVTIYWNATDDDNYWTAGKVGVGIRDEIIMRSSGNVCSFFNFLYIDQLRGTFFISNNRSSNLISDCTTDSTNGNCGSEGLCGVYDTIYDFKSDGKYSNLHQSDVGNFNLAFTFP